MLLYRDGVLVGSESRTDLTSWGEVQIASYNCGALGTDSLAYIAMYDKALTADQIAAHACVGGVASACALAPDRVSRSFGNTAATNGFIDGEPVNSATGNMVETYTDVIAPGDVYGLDFVRTYNSLDGDRGLLGPGWSTSLDTSLVPLPADGGFILRLADGRRFSIGPDGSGGWLVPPELYAELTVVSGGYELRFGTGEVWAFDGAGRLTGKDDGLGQSVTISRGSGGYPITATSSNAGEPGWSYQLLGGGPNGHASAVVGPYAAGGSSSGAPRVDFGYELSAFEQRLSKASRPFPSGSSPVAWQYYDADANGFVAAVRDDFGSPGPAQVTRVSTVFDDDGVVQEQSLLGGEHLTFDYSVPGETTIAHRPGPAGVAQELVVVHDEYGNVTSVRDPFGVSTDQSMTDDRPSSFRGRVGLGVGGSETTYETDPTTGETVSVALPDPVTGAPVAGTGGAVTEFCPDGYRVRKSTSAAGVETIYTYGSGCDAGVVLPTSVSEGGAVKSFEAQLVGTTASNLPVKVIDADGVEVRLHWDVGRRLLLSASDDPGTGPRTTFYGYDDAGRRTVVRTPGGIESWALFNSDGTAHTEVGPVQVSRSCAMTATSCAFPASPPTGGPLVTGTHYGDGTVKSRTVNGQTTELAVTYPAGGGVVRTETPPQHRASDGSMVAEVRVTTEDALGRITSVRVGDPARPGELATTTFAYDDPLNPTAGALKRPSYTTGPTGVRTYFTYDADGNVINEQVGGVPPDRTAGPAPTVGSNGCWTITSPYGDPTRSTSMTYDARGRLTDVCGPTGDTGPSGAVRSHTRYGYDNADRVVEVTDGDTAGVMLKQRSIYDPVTGRLTRTVVDQDASGGLDDTDVVTEYVYTKAGRVAAIFTAPKDVVSFTWPTATPLATWNGAGDLVVNAQGTRVTTYAHDGAGQVSSMVDPANKSTTYTYTSDGQVLRETSPGGAYRQYGYDAFGNVASSTAPSPTGTGSEVSTFTYDLDNRLVAMTTPAPPGQSTASTVDYGYYADGRLETVTNALGGAPSASNPNTVTYTYDSRGNRTGRASKNNPNPSSPATYVDVVQSWAYDVADNLVSASPDGTSAAATTYIYDDDLNPNDPAYPNGTTTPGQGTGRLRTIIQPSGRSQTMDHWNSGQVRHLWEKQGSTETVIETFYDQRGRRIKVHDDLDGTGQDTTYTWTTRSQLASVVKPALPTIADPSYSYTYSLAGTPMSLTYPDTSQHNFYHDALDRLTTVRIVWPGLGEWPIVGYAYDDNGNVTSERTDFTRSVIDWTYPANGASRAIGFEQVHADVGTRSTAMTYGPSGQIATETTGSTSLAYTYDPAGQLIARTGGSVNDAYTYNAHGGRTQVASTGSTLTQTFNVLDQVTNATVTGAGATTRSYTWDQDGRRTGVSDTAAASTETITYDHRGLPALTALTTPSGTVSAARTYNADRRVTQVTDPVSSLGSGYVWDDTTSVPVILDGRFDAAPTVWLRMNYGLAQVGYKAANDHTVAFAMDQYRNVYPSPDNTAVPSSYDPWGASGPASPHYGGFTYRSSFQLGNLIHLVNRDYDPVTAQFTSRDPLDGVDGTPTVANPYHYVDNDPLNKVDPAGLRPIDDQALRPECIDPDGYQKLRSAAGGYLDALGGRWFTSGSGGYCENNGWAGAGSLVGSFVPGTDCLQLAANGIHTDLDTALSAGGCALDVIPAAGAGSELAEQAARHGDEVASVGRHTDEVADATKVGSSSRGASSLPCGNSFVSGTQVLLADGTRRAIEDVGEGEFVWARDPVTGEAGARRVVDVISGAGSKELVDVGVEGGSVTATGQHPFWVDDEGRWVDAADLVVGDDLEGVGGEGREVGSVAGRVAVARVHNLTIEGVHTFYVFAGSTPLLVHNSNPCTPRGAGGAADAASGARLSARLAADEIASGHAYTKHVVQRGEFPGIRTRTQFADMVENVINNYDDVRHLSGGRTAYWRDGVVVIRNPGAPDGGSAFVPRDGYDYFLGLG